MRLEAAERARNSCWSFARFMAPEGYDFNWHHRILYDAMDRFARGETKRLIVQAPPGHGKSEAISRNLPAYLLGRNPNERIIACSHTGDLASDMNRDVQGIMDSDRYASVFPASQLAGKGRQTAGRARRTGDVFDIVGRRGYYRSAGVQQGISGRRFSMGLIDDPIKGRENANSPTMRESVWRWYTGEFLNRQAKNASICITLTRWHEDDLVGRILAKEPKKWEVITLPAVADGINVHPLDPRAPGEALWPWFRPLAELNELREIEPRDFAALYQQNPRAEGGQEWPNEYFSPDIWFTDWPSEIVLKVLTLDPSKGKDAKHGDYSALVSLGMTRDKMLWCDADLQRRPTPRIVEDGLRIFTEWGPQAFVVEANGFQELLGSEFVRVAREMGLLNVPLHTITNTIKKEVRIRQIGPLLAQKRIRFKGGSPGAKLLVQQLRDFPTAEFDDGPDALQMAVVMLTTLLSGRKKGPGQPQVLTV